MVDIPDDIDLVDYDEENPKEDPKEELEEEPEEDVDIELEDDVELIFPYEVEGEKPPPPGDVSSDSVSSDSESEDEEVDVAPEATVGTITQKPYAIRDFLRGLFEDKIREKERELLNHDLENVERALGNVLERMSVLENKENATLKKRLAETETKLVWARMERETAEGRLHESRVRNKIFYLDMIVMENPNHLNEPNEAIPENPKEDPKEELEEEPEEDVDIELQDDVELIFPYEVEEDEEVDVAPEAAVGTITQKPYAIRDFLRGLFEVGESSSALMEAELGTCQTDIALLKSKDKIREKERELLNHDLENVKHALGNVLERMSVLENKENAALKKRLAETETKLMWARMERETAEGRLHESRVRNKIFYLDMVR
nr:hypothetical protein [Tanacetum cinerariifolium]